VRPLPVANPPNPWQSNVVDYLGEPPLAPLQIFEDHTRSILSKNDSPDLGFTWSVNPYRGCMHACAYCISGDTEIWMGDGTTRPLARLRVGDEVYGTAESGSYRRYQKTRVLAHWSVAKPAYRLVLEDGTEFVSSADHRFLTANGWKHVADGERNERGRPHLAPNDRMMGPGRFAAAQARSLAGRVVRDPSGLQVASIRPLATLLPLFDITTETGDFIANGVVSHNCYARPSHEYLGFGSGTDFERKIVVKPDAAALLREAFERKSWKGELVMFSGNTDCYQPLEASYRLTRACLEVCAEYRNPAYVITKAPLIERDVELLARLSRETSFGVTISIPFWNEATARSMEPYVATPSRRIKTVKRLAEAGIEVAVNVAPICPGLNEEDMPTILEEAKAAGATSAAMTMLRLPGSVKEVFEERIRKELPLRAERILARTREVRGGRLNDPRFGQRQTGEGVYADAIAALFRRTSERLGLRSKEVEPDEPCTASTFRRPPRETERKSTEQLDLFGPPPPRRS
jgi:DNA repair photolyase